MIPEGWSYEVGGDPSRGLAESAAAGLVGLWGGDVVAGLLDSRGWMGRLMSSGPRGRRRGWGHPLPPARVGGGKAL